MRLGHQLRVMGLTAASIGAVACNGGSFKSGAEITGLRVLAAEKTPAYPQPGEVATVDVVYWDGKSQEGTGRDIQVCFFDCINPLGDLYYNCYPQIAANLAAGKTMSDGCPSAGGASDADGGNDGAIAGGASDADGGNDGAIAGGASDDGGTDGGTASARSPTREHRISIRSDIVTSHGPPASGPSYGLAYVLFTVCAGHIGLRSAASANDLPLTCLDDGGSTLGPDDFVPGYTSLYTYDPTADRRNNNPLIDDLLFAGSPIWKPPGPTADATIPHVPACSTGDCEIDFKVDVNRSSAEPDPSSTGLNGIPLQEELWVNFYATRGEFTKDVRLINDSASGWNDDNATKFKVPSTEGPVHLWAVVHDNRGGVAVSEGDIVVSATGE